MPYFYDPNLDPNKDDSQGSQLAGSGELLGGNGQTQAATGGGQAGQPSATRSDRFQNLNDYLSANENSGFADQFGDKVSGDISKAGDAQNQAGQVFKSQSDSGTNNFDEGFTNSALSDPYAFSQNQGNVDKFKAQKNSDYKGPNSFADSADSYQKAYGATQKSQDVAQNYGNEQGRFSLLDNYFGRPGYNQGEKNLDQLLVQGGAHTSQNIEQAKNNATNYQQNLDKMSSDLGGYAAQNRATSQATQQKTRDALGLNADNSFKATDNVTGNGAFQDVAEGLDAKALARQNELKTINAKLAPIAGAGSSLYELGHNQKDLDPYGLNYSDFDDSHNIDFTNYLYANRGTNSFGSNLAPYVAPFYVGGTELLGESPKSYLKDTGYQDVNRTTMADPDTVNKLKALSQLAEVDNPYFDPTAEAGSQVSGKNPAFDAKGFTTAVSTKREALRQELQDALDGFLGIAKAPQDPGKLPGGEVIGSSLVPGLGGAIGGIGTKGTLNPQSLENLKIEANRIRAKYGLGAK